MTRVLSLFIFCCIAISGTAQFVIPNKADVEKLSKRKLIVGLFADEDNIHLNEYFKAQVQAAWKYGEVEFSKDPMDIPEKIAGKKSEYAVMYFSQGQSSILGWATVGTYGSFGTQGAQSVQVKAMVDRFKQNYYSMRIALPEKNYDVFEVGVPISRLDSLNITFIMKQMNQLMKASLDGETILDLGKTFGEFKQKKVYISEADLPAKGKEYLQKNFKHDHAVVSAAEFAKLVTEQNTDGCYVTYAYCDGMKRNAIVAADIKTGRIYARVGHQGADCKTMFSGQGPLYMSAIGICPKNLTYFDDEGEQKKQYNF